jgi:invasion protein IalB
MPIRTFAVRLLAVATLTIVAAQPGFAQQRVAQAPSKAPAPAQKSPAPAPPPAAAPPAAAPAQPPAQAGQPPKNPGWASRCTSESRQSPVECAMEQTVVLTSSGQLLASFVLRFPANTREPLMMVQVPVGLFLPAGLSLQVDENKPVTLALQTCDLKGCYAGAPVPADMLNAMKSGKRLLVTFQNMAKENVGVPLSLENFSEAYQKMQ